jgi:hypothetical protein
MRIRDLFFGLILALLLLLGYKAAFPSLLHVDIELTGPPGAKITGTYDCDGATRAFTRTLPTTISFDMRRSFNFRAEKEDPSITLVADMRSGFGSGGTEADPSYRGIEASYRATIQGFSSRGSIGPTK